MFGILKRSNDALHANPNVFHYPSTTDINITTHGSDWYWAVTGVMIVATISFIGLSFTVPRRNRIFHYITAAITLVASIAYFTMASNLGYVGIIAEFQRSNPKVAGVYREIFYVRYIDWFVTTPVSPSFSHYLRLLTSFAASSLRLALDSRYAMANDCVHSHL
jgi:bacteriorhodopsin